MGERCLPSFLPTTALIQIPTLAISCVEENRWTQSYACYILPLQLHRVLSVRNLAWGQRVKNPFSTLWIQYNPLCSVAAFGKEWNSLITSHLVWPQVQVFQTFSCMNGSATKRELVGPMVVLPLQGGHRGSR